MATVFKKLNYTNQRSKSKSKDAESESKPIKPESELFSHMNQDNLKYIQNQIKQKNRKASQSARLEEEPTVLNSYPDLIEERDSKYEETERQTERESYERPQEQAHEEFSVFKTEGESVRAMETGDLKKGKSDEGETYKLSYYDMISQAKSKRVSSIEGYFDDEKPKENFISFLDHYISDLNKSPTKAKPYQAKENRKKPDESHGILVKAIGEQKRKNLILAKQIERYHQREDENRKRIEGLEGMVALLSEQMESLRQEIRSERESHRNEYRSMAMTMDLRADNSRLSRHSQLAGRGATESRGAMERQKRGKHQEILQLQNELRMFEETGELIGII